MKSASRSAAHGRNHDTVTDTVSDRVARGAGGTDTDRDGHRDCDRYSCPVCVMLGDGFGPLRRYPLPGHTRSDLGRLRAGAPAPVGAPRGADAEALR